MSKDKLTKIKLAEADVQGVVCSSNAIDGIIQTKAISIDCEAVVRGNDKLSGSLNSNILVVCPPGCGADTTLPLYGTSIYLDNSSVCKAGLHYQAIADE